MNISSYPGQGTPYGYRHDLIDGFGLQYVLGETSHTTTPEERELMMISVIKASESVHQAET
jgi:hypothetical protein